MNKVLNKSSILNFIIFNISVIFMIYVFSFQQEKTWIAYVTYLLSTYSCIVFCIWVYKLLKKVHCRIKNHQVYQLYKNNSKMVTKMSLYLGTIMNVIYCLFKLIAGIYYQSIWFITFAVYYFLLSFMRVTLLHSVRKNDLGKDIRKEYQKLKVCGILLLLLDIILCGIIILIIHHNQSIHYAGYIIYLVALYDFYFIIRAFMDVFQYRKHTSPILTANKCIHLTVAMIAMLSLEVAMITQFGGVEDASFKVIMVSCSGFFICLINFLMSIWMIVKANRNLKIIR